MSLSAQKILDLIVVLVKRALIAILPALLITIVTCICAGAIFGSILLFVSSLKSFFIHDDPSFDVQLFIQLLIWTILPAVYMTFLSTFLPNLLGIFVILFSNLGNKFWLMNLSRKTFYAGGSVYGVLIFMIAFGFSFFDDADAFLSSSAYTIPTAMLSGVLAFKFMHMLLRYKLENNDKEQTS